VLEELIAIYRDWDAFQHSTLQDDPIRRLAARLRAVTLKMVRLGLRLIEGQALAGNQAFLDELEGSWQEDRRSQSDVHRLVDVYCAAERRARAAKYDDAIARLYRCLEMSGTILLLRDWQFTSIQRPDYGALASALGGEAALRDAFQRRARYPLPEKLGLDAQMTLLAVGGKHGAVAGIYAGMKKGTHGLMEGRNRSILAHGTVPVSEAVYRRFSLKTADVISRVAGKECLARLVEQATHPTILL